MVRFIPYLVVGIITSFYFFPISFTFLPSSVNTKMILAVIGIVLAGYRSIKEENINIPRQLLLAIGIAIIFSLICFISTDINYTNDYSYAGYIVSFFVWLGGAYTVCDVIRYVHGQVDFKIITLYLAGVCVTQCILAMMIDSIPAFRILVNTFVSQGQEFLDDVGRLYGIGASLDPAGVRFSLVLVMIAGLLANDKEIRQNNIAIALLLIAFFTISIVGNIISRTTIIGMACGIAYFVISSGLFRLLVRYDSIKLGILFGLLLLTAVVVSVYLYNSNDAFYGYMRFAFEGFFNWAEKGEWSTSSTDKLNREMWIWPEDQRTWLIGSGLFDNFVYDTDIGYCRFILYCGLIGFSVFAFLFIYLGAAFALKEPKYRLMFLIFMLLTFVFWFKVATDIFFIYALFFCLDQFVVINEKEEISYENNI
ncbi:hypothetical protein HZP42_13460 [Elizabethkingia anophelis]|uniref:hypothetical protein n=1 Tax=Elizabethkingia anophelis TaxID=1117645 RepID=UPI000665359F|nr:hypothetical protein [Elizabethkingia anophelis]AQW92601.1 hypothetical protein BBD28_11295 [Elizabethkingia anophelis]KUY14320.1 hypothetical protein ATB94_08675 [Elizabethkingia anophelis]MCT3726530.1 hypothetical protein [Elizabethkingia anophelis]MCT4237397.1 hypothetical protein [Elizabethkingia anophelis]MCT4318660.1 hypothetical protein [Elizabethkingia anophelis]